MFHNFDGDHIEVVCGPMFAGKTEELIRRIKRLDFAKKKYLVFKPKIDNRYGDNVILSHNKNTKKAINVEKSTDILKHVTDEYDVIIIDERSEEHTSELQSRPHLVC